MEYATFSRLAARGEYTGREGMRGLQNRVAVVSGAASGIGGAIARRLAEEARFISGHGIYADGGAMQQN